MKRLIGFLFVAAALAATILSLAQPGAADPVAGHRLTMTSDDVPVFWPPRGQVFYVCSATGSATATGRSPVTPLTTIDAAINKCTASRGDVILVLPGHAETINTAGGIDADVIGISIIGLGNGALRPTITLGSDETATTVTVDAANIRIENLRFVVGVDSLVIGIDVNADDCTIKNCEFRAGSSKEAITFVDATTGAANGADRLKVIGCKFVQTADGGDRAIELGEVNDEVEITGCVIDGDWDDAGIHNPTGKTMTNLLIKDCVIANRDSGEHAIELVSACTGFAVNNYLYGNTLGTILDPGSLMCLGNMEVDAVDQAGVATPGTTAGPLPAGAIATTTFASGAIDAAAIAADALTTAELATGCISADEVAADALGASEIATDALGAAELAADAVAEIADGIADEAVSGHTTAGTVGAMLQPLHSGTASAAAAGTITLQNTASALADFYNGNVIQIIAGTGAGQSRVITDYAITTFQASIAPNWITTPDATSKYVVYGQGPCRVEDVTTGAIDADAIAADAIGASEIATAAIDADAIAADAIGAAELAADAVAEIAAATFTGIGTEFWVKKTLTSSAIVQAGVDITGVSSAGELAIEDVIVKTNSTGLAAGTNLEICSNNANGLANILVETVANLGANKTMDLTGASVTKIRPVLEVGKKLIAKSTVADCTGAGTIDVYVKFKRLTAAATVAAAP